MYTESPSHIQLCASPLTVAHLYSSIMILSGTLSRTAFPRDLPSPRAVLFTASTLGVTLLLEPPCEAQIDDPKRIDKEKKQAS